MSTLSGCVIVAALLTLLPTVVEGSANPMAVGLRDASALVPQDVNPRGTTADSAQNRRDGRPTLNISGYAQVFYKGRRDSAQTI